MTATTLRERMTAKRRHHIFSENCTGHNKASCCLCGLPVYRHEAWRVEHVRALGLAGKDLNSNCAPAHLACALTKDRADMGLIAKAKRMQAAHEGSRTPRRQWKPDGAVFDWKRRRYVMQAAGEVASA